MQRHLISRRPAAALLIALVASVTIAACGGSGSSGSSAASTTNAGLKLATCMRAHGVPDFPDPGSSNAGNSGTTGNTGSGPKVPPGKVDVDGHVLAESSRVVDTAYTRCQKYEEALQGPRISTAQLVKFKAGALAYAKCVRAHGVPDFPDPTVETGPGGHGAGIAPPYGSGASARKHDTPALQAAIKTCSSLVEKVTPGAPGQKG
jgi:hypothetical protein